MASYFLGVCQDFKHFGFAVSVIILNAEGTKVVRLLRKEACYCRFAVADKSGRIPQILYANLRCVSHSRMRDVVNFIRHDPDEFPEWHSSPTVWLFSPPKFENKKSASGYWF